MREIPKVPAPLAAGTRIPREIARMRTPHFLTFGIKIDFADTFHNATAT
jgi:hypothetical protein